VGDVRQMKLIFKKDFYCLKKGLSIEIEPNKVNFWVGSNGSGKSTATSILMTLLQKQFKMEKKETWMATNVQCRDGGAKLEGFENTSDFSFSSEKVRQAQWVSIDTFDLMEGVGRLRASEGENILADFTRFVKHKDDPNHVYLFDEMDGHLDVRYKGLFFDRFLPNIKGTVVVVTHDIYYTVGQERVFNFDTKTFTTGTEYIYSKLHQ
jgi:ATPase subunit of ABC transporter with duplicated ATPase domains